MYAFHCIFFYVGKCFQWGWCSQSCANGEELRRRGCNNPAPESGGKDCEGAGTEKRFCNDFPCPSETFFYLFVIYSFVINNKFCRIT